MLSSPESEDYSPMASRSWKNATSIVGIGRRPATHCAEDSGSLFETPHADGERR
jgi:hypothetical protein